MKGKITLTLTIPEGTSYDLLKAVRGTLDYVKTTRDLASPHPDTMYTHAFYQREEEDDDPYAVLVLRIDPPDIAA